MPGYANIFAIAEITSFQIAGGEVLPGVAPVAIQQARYVAGLIWKRIEGKPERDFEYKDKGTLAVIGRKSVVGYRNNFKISGVIAWLI